MSDRSRITLAGAVLLGVLLGGCETLSELGLDLDRPTVRVAGARLEQITLDGAALDLDLDVTNPYAAPLPLLDVEYAVGSGGRSVISGRADLDGTVPARGSRTLRVPVAFRFSDVIAALGGVRPGSVVPYSLDATLATNAPGLGRVALPLATSGEIPIPAVPEVGVTGVRWQRLGLDEAAAIVSVRIASENQFPVDLVDFDYGLALGGATVVRVADQPHLRLAAGAPQTLSLPVSFRPADLGLAFLDVLRGGRADYRLQGTMQLTTPFGPMALPFDSAGTTPLAR